MSRIKQLIHEVHRRSLWQVLAIYIAGCWFVLQAVDVLTESYGLPRWFPAVALALLLIGLPIVLATAFVQEGGPAVGRGDPTLLPETAAEPQRPEAAGTGRRRRGIRRFLTWRNAIAGGVMAFALWGVVTAVWLATGSPGLLVKAEAADFFSARDKVVVAEFENETDQPTLALAVREAVITDLAGSAYVNVLGRNELNAVLGRMRLPDTVRVDEDVALEVARREGYPAVVTGTVAPLGTGFQLSARIVETATGEVAVRVRETAAGAEEVVSAVERLSRLARRHLGESLDGLRRSPPLPDVTTGSLEALELYALGIEHFDRGDAESAIRLFQQAVAVDTAFAAAYRALAVAYGNQGNTTASLENADRAYRHAERLPERERLLTAALVHYRRNRFDSTAFYYRLAADRFPDDHVAVNNLGDVLELMGRYEEALPHYRRGVELSPDAVVGYGNVASAARTLGRHALADSMLTIMLERFADAPFTRWTAALNAYYQGDFEAADSAARALVADGSPLLGAWGRYILAGIAGMRGQIDRALIHADSAAELATPGGTQIVIYMAARAAQHVGLAAGASDRARPLLERVRRQADEETAGPTRYFGLGIAASGHALAGDLTRARRILATMDSLADASDFRPLGEAQTVRAVLALQEGRAQAALEHLRQAATANYGLLFRDQRLLLADAYAALDRLPEAAAHYDTMTRSHGLSWRDAALDGPLRPVAHERLGHLYLAMGDTAAAARHLAEFTELWQDAHPALRPRVDAARRQLTRLLGEGR